MIQHAGGLTVNIEGGSVLYIVNFDGVFCDIVFTNVFDDQCMTGSYVLYLIFVAGYNFTGTFVPCDWDIFFIQFTSEVTFCFFFNMLF